MTAELPPTKRILQAPRRSGQRPHSASPTTCVTQRATGPPRGLQLFACEHQHLVVTQVARCLEAGEKGSDVAGAQYRCPISSRRDGATHRPDALSNTQLSS
jgi:hypothetical protein